MAADLSGIVIAPPTRRAKAAGLYRKLKRLPIIPLSILGLVVFAGLFAPLLAPHDPEKGELRERNMPPAWSGGETALKTVVERLSINERTTSVTLIDAQEIDASAQLGDQIVVFTRPAGSSKFLLGTDHLGRDVLSRVIYGARISLLVSIVTLAVGGSIGITMGLVAGYYGGFIDEFLMRLVDIKLAIPLILIALVLVITLGQSLWIIVTVLCLFIWPRFARQVRGEVLQLKHMDYVSLAKVSGASTARILFIHIFPGTINTLIVVSTLQVGIVILLESTLSFLGAGVPPPTPAWGSMVADGRDKLAGGVWWISTFPGVAIML
ncbi:MAG: hypothetical protein COB86_09000, partial [Dehalococcoidia bacterium]